MKSREQINLFTAVLGGCALLILAAFTLCDLETLTDYLLWAPLAAGGLGMASQAVYKKSSDTIYIRLVAAASSGELIQLPDGRAGVVQGLSGANHAIGDTVAVKVCGIHTITKAAGIVLLDGGKVFWDHSANAATFRKVSDRDFYVGTVYGGDAASAATSVDVDLNNHPCYAIDLNRDPFDSAIVLTAGTPTLRYLGGAFSMEFSATAEAQKVDALSKDGFATGANAIIEGAIEIVDDGDAAAIDFNVGVANATDADDADDITESVFIHTDGNVTNILAESDDGTTQVAATDTTIDYVLGTRFEFWLDMRDPADVQIYINGVNVLPDSVFDVSAAAGPWKLLAHMEKSSDNTTAEYHVDWLRARLQEQK